MPDSPDPLLDVVIVGAGLAGLTAAYRLRDRNILLLEKEEIPGGRTESRTLGPYVYNAGAQVVLGDDGPLATLVDEIGVKRTLIAKSKLPMYINGKLVASPVSSGFCSKCPFLYGTRSGSPGTYGRPDAATNHSSAPTSTLQTPRSSSLTHRL